MVKENGACFSLCLCGYFSSHLQCGNGDSHKKTNTVRFYLQEVPRVGKFVETEGRMLVARGWEEGKSGIYCLMGRVSVLQVKKSFEDRLLNNVTALNSTELYT